MAVILNYEEVENSLFVIINGGSPITIYGSNVDNQFTQPQTLPAAKNGSQATNLNQVESLISSAVGSNSLLGLDNTWTGVQTFDQPIVIAPAVAGNQAVTLDQLNGITGGGGVSLSANNTWTGIQTFDQPITVANAGASNQAPSLGQVESLIQHNLPYDFAGGIAGVPTASEILLQSVLAREVTFNLNFSGTYNGGFPGVPNSIMASQFYVGTAPTNDATGNIELSGSSIGTWSVLAGSHTGTFSTVSGATYLGGMGQVLTVLAPATADATMANISFTILATLTEMVSQ